VRVSWVVHFGEGIDIGSLARCSTYYKAVRGGCVCLESCFITAGPITKLCAWGEEESGGHVL
jgi:hypothetical protein